MSAKAGAESKSKSTAKAKSKAKTKLKVSKSKEIAKAAFGSIVANITTQPRSQHGYHIVAP